MHRPRKSSAVVVTTAATSPVEERQARQRRYMWTMGIRTLLFALSVLLLHGVAQFIGMALSVILPGFAVIFANAAPVRPAGRPAAVPPPDRPSLAARPADPQHDDPVVIDAEPVTRPGATPPGPGAAAPQVIDVLAEPATHPR